MDICYTGKERKKERKREIKKERGYKVNMVLVIQNLQWLTLCINLYFS